MALAKKKYMASAKQRIKEKCESIHQQRDSIISYVNEMVTNADEVAAGLMQETHKHHFIQKYMPCMTRLEEVQNKLFIIHASLPDDSGESEDDSDDSTESNSCQPAAKMHSQSLSSSKCDKITDSPPKETLESVDTFPKQAVESVAYPTRKGAECVELPGRKVIESGDFPGKGAVADTVDFPPKEAIRSVYSPPREAIRSVYSPPREAIRSVYSPPKETIRSVYSPPRDTYNQQRTDLQKPPIISSRSQEGTGVLHSERQQYHISEKEKSSQSRIPEMLSQVQGPGFGQSAERTEMSTKDILEALPVVPKLGTMAGLPDMVSSASSNASSAEGRRRRRKATKGLAAQLAIVDNENNNSNQNNTRAATEACVPPSVHMQGRESEYGLGPSIGVMDFEEGSTLQVLVIEMETISLFWCQPISPDFEDLVDQMTVYHKRLKPDEWGYRLPCAPVPGMVVCAQYEDSVWYRACIMIVFEPQGEETGQLVEVFFLDFGNCFLTDVTKLRPLPEKFSKLPIQVIPCALSEVGPPEGSSAWSQEHVISFAKFVTQQQVHAIIDCRVPNCGLVFLELFVSDKPLQTAPSRKSAPTKTQIISIGKTLISMGLARKVTNKQISESFLQMKEEEKVKPKAPHMKARQHHFDLVGQASPIVRPATEKVEDNGNSDAGSIKGELKKIQERREQRDMNEKEIRAKSEQRDVNEKEIRAKSEQREQRDMNKKEIRAKSEQRGQRDMNEKEIRAKSEQRGQRDMNEKEIRGKSVPIEPNSQVTKDLRIKKTEIKADLTPKPQNDGTTIKKNKIKGSKEVVEKQFNTFPEAKKELSEKETKKGNAVNHDIEQTRKNEKLSEKQINEDMETEINVNEIVDNKDDGKNDRSTTPQGKLLELGMPVRLPSKCEFKKEFESWMETANEVLEAEEKDKGSCTNRACEKEDKGNSKMDSDSKELNKEEEQRDDGKGNLDQKKGPESERDDTGIEKDVRSPGVELEEDTAVLDDKVTIESSKTGDREVLLKEDTCRVKKEKPNNAYKELSKLLLSEGENTRAVGDWKVFEADHADSDRPELQEDTSGDKFSMENKVINKDSGKTPSYSGEEITKEQVGDDNVALDTESTKNDKEIYENNGKASFVSDEENKSGSSSPEAEQDIANRLAEMEVPPPSGYKPVEVSVGEDSTIMFMLSYIESPGRFFIHQVKKGIASQVDLLMKDLQGHFQDTNMVVLQRFCRPSINERCVARYSADGSLYRATVQSMTDQECVVQYVDFGNTESVNMEDIYPLPPKFATIPPLAVLCTLADTRPIELDGEEPCWSHNVTAAFEELTGYTKTLVGYVLSDDLAGTTIYLGENEKLPLLVVDTSREQDIWINQELHQLGLAISETLAAAETVEYAAETEEVVNKSGQEPTPAEHRESVEKAEDEEMGDWDPLMEDYMSVRNSYDIDTDDPGVAITGIKAKATRNICRFFASGQKCFKGELCQFEHVRPADGRFDQRMEIVSVCDSESSICLPGEGKWVTIEITAIHNPSHFYVAFPFGTSVQDLMKEESDDGYSGSLGQGETFDMLVESMCEYYNKRTFSDRDLSVYALGELVAVKYGESDKEWYRAKCVNVEPESHRIKVFYVDFGNSEWVDELKVRKIQPRFVHLPFQAVECFLPLDPVDEKWSQEAKDDFRELVDQKVLIAFVLASLNGMLTVDLYDTTNEEVYINQVLIEKGYAKPPVPAQSRRSPRSSSGSSRSCGIPVNFRPG